MTSGLYFPYVSRGSLTTLNCAALLFKEIFIINPFEVSIDIANNYKEYLQYFGEEQFGSGHPNVRFIPLQKILANKTKDQKLCLSIVADLFDTFFHEICSTTKLSSPFRISIGRISDPRADVVQRKYYVNLPAIADGQDFQNTILKGIVNYDEYDKAKLRYLRISDERKFIYDSKEKFKNITLPYDYALSLMINHIYIVKPELQSRTIFFTDKDIEHKILKYKLCKSDSTAELFLNRHSYEIKQVEVTTPVKAGKFSFPFLNITNSHHVIDCYSKYAGLFAKFKQKFSELLDKILVKSWKDDSHKMIQNEIEQTINPIINDIRKSLNSYISQLLERMVTSIEVKEAVIEITVIPDQLQKLTKLSEFSLYNYEISIDNVNSNSLNNKNCVILLISY